MFTSSIMNYQETTDYLFNALPTYQNQGGSAYKEDLDNTQALMEALDHPEKKFKSIHIAGTNGKGSVSHALAAIFQKCGYKTGLYTSPHLLDFRERVKIDGEMISEEQVIAFVEKHKDTFATIQPSFFEMTVALAFDTFAQEHVDVAIVETGLGGRLDSTNIVQPEASIITNISFDHAQILGDTLEKIAGEKAGIIKEGTPCILGNVDDNLIPIFEEVAKKNKTKIHLSSKEYHLVTQKTDSKNNSFTYNQNGKYFTIESDLRGKYQGENIATVLHAVAILDRGDTFKLPQGRVIKALKTTCATTGLRGRWETLQSKPLCIADTGHNEAGIAQIMEQIATLPQKRKFIIYGCVDDKELDRIFPLFDPSAYYIFTRSQNKRSTDEKVLLEKSKAYRLRGCSYPDFEKAIAFAEKSANPNDATIICGSTFLVADALPYFEG